MPMLSRTPFGIKKLNERIKSLPKKIIFIDKDLGILWEYVFTEKKSDLHVFQENLFSRLRAF